MTIKPVLLAVCVVLFGFLAQTPAQEKTHPDLTKSVVLDLPPGDDNPRNSEGAFVTLKNGDILFVYTRYVGTSDEDHAPASLAARVSKDKGETWSAEDRTVVANEGGMNVMSVSLLRLTDGRIALFYLRKNSWNDCRPFLRYSADEGATWSEPVECVTDEIGYYVLNNDRVMQQADGTLLMPLALHSNPEGKFRAAADIYCYVSKDAGATWQRQKQVPNPGGIVLQEPGLVQLGAGTILMYLRSNAGCQCYSFSKDGGANWSPVEKSPLVAPMSPAVIKNIPDSDELLAVWNDNAGNRNPMNIAVLSADAKTILVEKTLDFSPDNSRWFCYPALHFVDGDHFLVGYCAGERRIVGLNATRISKSSVRAVRAADAVISDDLRAMVESDWAFQESQKDRTLADPEAILELVGRAKLLAEDLGQTPPAFDPATLQNLDETQRRELYCKLRWQLRDLALANPLLRDTPLVFMKRNRFVCQMLHEYVGYYYKYTGTTGGEVCVLPRPGYSLETRSLTKDQLPGGAMATLSLSHDAKTLYFAHADFTLTDDQPRNVTWTQLGRHRFQDKTFEYLDGNEGKFRIYSMAIDGSDLRPLTDGRHDDFDPCELPDGGIAFLSTRRGGFVRCNNPWEPLPVYTLHRMDADGRNARTLSFHETNEWHPVVLNDGRVVYSRWDYVDRSAAHYHGLWTSNPDGTNPSIVFGNYTQMVSACYQPRAIPGSRKILFVAGAHHANTGGSLAMFDPMRTAYDPRTAEDELDTLERITPDVEFPETPNQWPATYYHSPWPLSEKYFFVSYSREPLGCFGALSDVTGRTGLYYLDRFGNLELLYEDADISCQYPIPIAPRSVPPVLPDRRDESLGETGELYLADVRNSLVPMAENRKIVELRVFELLPKWPDWTANSPKLGHANAEGARLFLGTVPVRDDGSAFFRIPAETPVYFQAVDADGKAVQTMRSSVYLQAGERRSCVGCHEPMHSTPDSFVAAGEPLGLTEGPDGTKPLSYGRLIQPILDRRCVSCHTGETSPGMGKVDLRGTPSGNFTASYHALRPYLRWYEWGGESIQQSTTLPGRCGADESPLTAILADANHGEKLDLTENELRNIYLWLDANVPFYGVYTDEERELQRQGQAVPVPAALTVR